MYSRFNNSSVGAPFSHPKPVTYIIQDIPVNETSPTRVIVQENISENIYVPGQPNGRVVRQNIYQADYIGRDTYESGCVTYMRQGMEDGGRVTYIVKDAYTTSWFMILQCYDDEDENCILNLHVI